jgi:serine/threonine protein kinase
MAEPVEKEVNTANENIGDAGAQSPAPVGRIESVVDVKPPLEFLTMKNLDTGEIYIVGETEPDFDLNTFELTGGKQSSSDAYACKEFVAHSFLLLSVDGGEGGEGEGEASPAAEDANVAPGEGRTKNNSGWWDRMLTWIYNKRNKDGSSSRARMNEAKGRGATAKGKTPFTKLSSFKFHRELGKGAFGRVLLAEAKIDGKLYALKIISKKDMRSSDKRQAKAERDILLAMSHNHSHPFTTGLKFAFQSAHNLYLGMDYFPGGNLKELIKKQGHLCEDWVRFYSAELILAISHLHSLHVIYRDIKPHNIMIDATGHIILIDYGLSKQAVSDSRGAQSLVGTPDYSAPEVLKTGVYRIEQANKEKERKAGKLKSPPPPKEEEAADIGYGKAADWWSVGVMMYEMLSGTPAFRGKDLRQTYQRVLFAELVFEPANRFSDDAKEILRGLLQRDPSLRLGAGENPPTDIMSMPFFKGIDWASIFERQENGPVVPGPVRLGPQGKDGKSKLGSHEYSTTRGNLKLNLRDSIISPGTLMNDPNNLQDWSFFDENALPQSSDCDKATAENTAKNAKAAATAAAAAAAAGDASASSSETAPMPPVPPAPAVGAPVADADADAVAEAPVSSLAHMTVDSPAAEAAAKAEDGMVEVRMTNSDSS